MSQLLDYVWPTLVNIANFSSQYSTTTITNTIKDHQHHTFSLCHPCRYPLKFTEAKQLQRRSCSVFLRQLSHCGTI